LNGALKHFLQGIKKIDYLVDILVDHLTDHLVEIFLQNHQTDCQKITIVNNKA